jgi:hypothetical protein
LPKKQTIKTAKKEVEPTFTPLMAERMWLFIKDVSAQRVKELNADRKKSEQLYELADKVKKDFISTTFPQLTTDGGELLADDILIVLTTMALTLANEMFEQNDEIMEIMRTPDEEEQVVGKPVDPKFGNPLYI